MSKRANKKVQKLEHCKELPIEIKTALENRRRQLTKKYEEEMRFMDRLLAKPTAKEDGKEKTKE